MRAVCQQGVRPRRGRGCSPQELCHPAGVPDGGAGARAGAGGAEVPAVAGEAHGQRGRPAAGGGAQALQRLHLDGAEGHGAAGEGSLPSGPHHPHCPLQREAPPPAPQRPGALQGLQRDPAERLSWPAGGEGDGSHSRKGLRRRRRKPRDCRAVEGGVPDQLGAGDFPRTAPWGRPWPAGRRLFGVTPSASSAPSWPGRGVTAAGVVPGPKALAFWRRSNKGDASEWSLAF